MRLRALFGVVAVLGILAVGSGIIQTVLGRPSW